MVRPLGENLVGFAGAAGKEEMETAAELAEEAEELNFVVGAPATGRASS